MRSVTSVGLTSGIVGAVGLMAVAVVGLELRTGTSSGRDATIHAAFERGERLWHASCPVPEIAGACEVLGAGPRTTPPGLPRYCGASERRAVIVPRDAFLQSAALAELATTSARSARDLGLARVYEGDAWRETALALPFPKDLDFDSTEPSGEDSKQRFHAWIEARTAVRERAEAKYDGAAATGDAEMIIAALARRAQLAEDEADRLFTVEIPSPIRANPDAELAQDKVDAFCDQLTVVAEQAADLAVKLYTACFANAAERAPFSEWSALCQSGLERLKPDDYPALHELRRKPSHDASTPLGWMSRIDAGLHALQFGRYAAAEQLFAAAVELEPTSYDALIGLGIAQRGLGDLDGAETSYERARTLDPGRGEAYYDLGILYEDFRSSHQASLPDAIVMYQRARAWFERFRERAVGVEEQTFDAAEAIADCDKVISQLEEAIAAEGRTL